MIYVYLEYLYNLGAFPFNNINDSISFLNNLSHNECQNLTDLNKSYGIGSGEVILYLLNENSTISNKEYDLLISNDRFEIKKDTPILSGGTDKSILTDLITCFNLIDKHVEINIKSNLTYVNQWKETFPRKWNNINLNQFNSFFNVVIPQLRENQTPEVISILNFIDTHNISYDNLVLSLKQDFIKNIDYLIFIDKNYKYSLITPQQFINTWEFDGITRGNRVKFKI